MQIIKKINIYLVILIDSIIPLIVVPVIYDYFYYPKIMAIYILLTAAIIINFIGYKKQNISFKFPKELILIVFFMTMIFLSALFSEYKIQAFLGRPLRYEGMLTYLSYFLILYISMNFTEDVKDLKLIIYSVVISACAISVIGILQYIGVNIIPKDSIRKSWNHIAFSTLGNPDFLGSYLSIVFPITLSLFLFGGKSFNEKFLNIASIILFIALICTNVRSAWVGTFFSLIFIFVNALLNSNTSRRIAAIMLSIFIASIVIINNLQGGALYSKFNSLIKDYKTMISLSRSEMEKSYVGSQRLFIWARSMEYILQRPILGSGPDTFDKVFKMTKEEAVNHFGSRDIFVDKAHNEYLQIVITLGFPALIFYIVFLFMLSYKSIFTIVRNRDNFWTASIFSGILAYIIQAFFNISVVSVAPIFWSMIGLLISSYSKSI